MHCAEQNAIPEQFRQGTGVTSLKIGKMEEKRITEQQ